MTESAQAKPATDISPDGYNPYLFALSASEPDTYDGGDVRGAHEQNFPILKGQKSAVYLVHLEVGGIREPHWHPSAWEATYIISGRAKWLILGTHPGGHYHPKRFEAGTGDLVFIPDGYFHYFENASDCEPLIVLIHFNNSTREANDDLGIVASLSSIPNDVLEPLFKVPAGTFDNIPKNIKPVVITKHQ
jgi:oxalate decarboxylase